MAEIRVEPKKRSLAWLWALLALAVIALVAWYLNNDGVDQVDVAPATSMAAPVVAPALTPLSVASTVGAPAHMRLVVG
jgi:hypothetical protein